MKKILLALGCCLLLIQTINAQYETMIINYEKSCFNENEALPAAKYFMMQGIVQENIPYVEVRIYSGKGYKKGKKPIHETFWKSSKKDNSRTFAIPINFKLRGNSNYDVLINYYRPTTNDERAKIKENIFKTLDAYVNESFELSSKKMEFKRSERQVMNDLNTIVNTGFSLYRNRTLVTFKGFSDMVKVKLAQINSTKLKKASKVTGDDRSGYRKKVIEDLSALLHREVNQYFNNDLYVLVDDKIIADYPTKKLGSALPLNVGYGAAFFNYDPQNFDYGTAPYIGLSFPLGKEGAASPFLSNSSISIGAFVTNFKNQAGDEISGPIFKRPTYAGYGYRFFRFIRLNAGVAFTESVATAGGTTNIKTNVKIQPFLGLSAEFRISLGQAD